MDLKMNVDAVDQIIHQGTIQHSTNTVARASKKDIM